MNLFSALFGGTKKPNRSQMDLLIQYAQLAEDIGTEALSQGVEESQLPGTKAELREIIAIASLQPWHAKLVLKSDDLVKLYGILEFFLSSDDLLRVETSRTVAEELDNLPEEGIPEGKRAIFEGGFQILQNAINRFQNAEKELRAHAARIR